MNRFKRIITYVLIVSLSTLSACVIGRGGGGHNFDRDDGRRDGDNYRHTLAYQHPGLDADREFRNIWINKWT